MNDDAVRALRLANSYIDDISGAVEPIADLTSQKAPEILADIARAIAQIEKAESLDPHASFVRETEHGSQSLTCQELRAAALMYQGLTEALAIGDLDVGARTLERALSLAPGFAHGYFALAIVHEERGKRTEARRAASRAAELAPDNIEYEKLADRLLSGTVGTISAAAGASQKQAQRKIFTSYFVAAAGFLAGFWFGNSFLTGLQIGLVGAYLLWSCYWAMPVVWRPFWRFFKQFPLHMAVFGWLFLLFFFYVPFVVGYMYAMLGGGIYQFLKFRNLAVVGPSDALKTPRVVAFFSVAAALAIFAFGGMLATAVFSRSAPVAETVPSSLESPSAEISTPGRTTTAPLPTASGPRSPAGQSVRWSVGALPVARGLGKTAPRISTLALIDPMNRPVPYTIQYEPHGFLAYVADHLRARKSVSLLGAPEGFPGSESTVTVSAGATVRIVEAFSDVQTPAASVAERQVDMILPSSNGAAYSITQGTVMVPVHDTAGECATFLLSTSGFRDLCWPQSEVHLKAYGGSAKARTAFLVKLEDGRTAWTPFINEDGPAEGWLAGDWLTCTSVTTGPETKMYCNEQ